MEENRITRQFDGFEIVYHKSEKICIERPGDDPAAGRTYGPLAPRTVVYCKGDATPRAGYAAPCDLSVEYDAPLVMRDGAVLRCNIFRPLGGAPTPVILCWTPYGKDQPDPNIPDDDDSIGANIGRGMRGGSPWRLNHGPDPIVWVPHGYTLVFADVRGASNSEGIAEYFGNGQDSDDIYDAVEFIAAQPWCTGSVCMMGASWLAICQYYAAAKRPPHLSCIVPCEGHGNMYRDEYVRMGIPDIGFARDFFTAGGTYQEDVRAMIRKYPTWNAYWASKSVPFERITLPAYFIGGFFSFYHVRGTFEAFRRISSEKKWIYIHNSDNCMLEGSRDFCEKELIPFCDHFCKGAENGWEETPRVRLSVLDPHGPDIVDRPETDWPIPREVRRTLYLDAATHTITETLPGEAQAAYDAEVPFVYCETQDESFARSDPSGRCDFVYTFDEDTEVVGQINVHLWVEADGYDDMDLFVRAITLNPDGSFCSVPGFGKQPYSGPDNRLRVSLRALKEDVSTERFPEHSFETVEKLSPGEIVPVVIPLWPTSLFFRKGDKLQISVAGYDFMGHAVPGGERNRVLPDNHGRHILHTGGKYDARIVLPILPRG